jgi:hypothetical protein
MDRIRTFDFADACELSNLVRMNSDRDRVISISLSESEWQAFTARHPEPVNWLRDRILTELQNGAREIKPEGFKKDATARAIPQS